MNNFNRATIFATSVLLVFSVFVVSGGITPNPVEGAPPVSSLTLNADNAPSISSGVPGNGTVGYKNSVTFHYDLVQDTGGAHTTITSGGSIYNDSVTSITSIASISATYSGPGTLYYGVNFHRETVVANNAMNAEGGTAYLSDDCEFFEVKATGGDVVLTNLTITYTCVQQYPVQNFYDHGSYSELGWVTRDPYSVIVDSTHNELPVTGIAANALQWSPSLQAVMMPSGITSIGNSALNDCAKLTSVSLPNTLISIGENAFENDTLITQINLPSTLTTIANSGFKHTGLVHVILPDGFTTLAGFAFTNCASLIDMVIPTSLTIINDWTFSGCTSLYNLYYRGNATQWGAITVGENGNSDFSGANVYYYSETDPSASGYWHYVSGTPTLWPV